MIRAPRLLLLPLALLLVGCVPKVAINSMPTRAQSAPLDRVFLLFGTGPGGSGEQMTQLNSALTRHLSVAGVETKGWVKNFLTLDEGPKIRAELDRFQPHYLLKIEQTSVTTTNGAASGTSLDLQLDDARTGDSAWKARLTYDGPSDSSADLMAVHIMGALRQDGLLPTAAPAPK